MTTAFRSSALFSGSLARITVLLIQTESDNIDSNMIFFMGILKLLECLVVLDNSVLGTIYVCGRKGVGSSYLYLYSFGIFYRQAAKCDKVFVDY